MANKFRHSNACKVMKKYFIGIDVSKETLDIALFSAKNRLKDFDHIQITNDKSGFKVLFAWLNKLSKERSEFMICLEHTGIYTLEICLFFEEYKYTYTLLCPLDLKKKMGLVRGKNDKIDSYRIAEHCYLYRNILKPTRLPSKELRELKYLLNERNALVSVRAKLKRSRTEQLKQNNESHLSRQNQLYDLIDAQIKEVEAEILSLIKESTSLFENYKLITSIKGIGMINAVYFLVMTQNFTTFRDARSYACYIGVAPFEHSSGKSVRGGCRTSIYGNKHLKGIITEAAKSAIKYDVELKAYYNRKKDEGKSHGCVINAVKFKLILRVFSVIRRQKAYVEALNFELTA